MIDPCVDEQEPNLKVQNILFLRAEVVCYISHSYHLDLDFDGLIKISTDSQIPEIVDMLIR